MAVGTGLAILGGALFGTAGSIYAGNKASKAAGKAADSQLQYAKEAEARATANRERAFQYASQAARANPAELLAMKRMIDRSESSLSKQIEILDQADNVLRTAEPVYYEAASETLKLLKGEEAKVLGPLRAQREKARLTLENRLAERLGPGFRTSSAGILALNQFDEATSNAFTNAQLAAVNQVGGLTGTLGNFLSQGRGAVASQLRGAYEGAQQTDRDIINATGNIAQRGVQAAGILSGTPVQSQLADIAGNKFAGEIAQANTLGNLFGNLGQAGVNYGMQQQYIDAIRQGVGTDPSGGIAAMAQGLPGGEQLQLTQFTPPAPQFRLGSIANVAGR